MTRLRMPPESVREKLSELSARTESLEQQLVRAQRLATLGTLSMSVAHEFNNLLMTIINHADTALATNREESMRRALEKTMACGEKASTMIRNMLGYAGTGGSTAQRLKASQLMEDAMGLMARDPAKDGIRLARQYDESLEVEGSPVEFTQVLLNLLINARHAMSAGGGTLTLRVRREEGYAAVDVADTGVGIPAEHMEKLFQPFFTTKRDSGGGGSGLGLYLSREIVRRYGGDISVVSRPDQGATFTVYLPLTS